jgi:transposase
MLQGWRCPMAESSRRGETRRVFSAEFKVEAVRRMEERRAGGTTLTQIGRELGVRPDQLRKWKRQHNARAGAAPADVFPGQGMLPSEPEELRRLQRENARLQQEVAFLKSAAAYFARESR